MDKSNESKKCFCTRCFLPVDQEDRVDIEGQNFHRICSMCCYLEELNTMLRDLNSASQRVDLKMNMDKTKIMSNVHITLLQVVVDGAALEVVDQFVTYLGQVIQMGVCRTIPTSLKMFYGHVFCNSCFKSHVMNRLKGDNCVYSNSWWMQWAPHAKPTEGAKEDEAKPQTCPEEPLKRGVICARCLQPVDENCKVQIGEQSFHATCAQCYFCHSVPTANPKIYYGQVFCEDCFHRHVLNNNKDNPSEFFRSCFESWQNNAQFADNMRDFMAGNKESTPFVFMMQGPQPPFCRCGTGPQDCFQSNEPKKSATATPGSISIGEESLASVELSFENRTEVSEIPESSAIDESANQENFNVDAAEKIEKLTKYLHERVVNSEEKYPKKWKNFIELDDKSSVSDISYFGWIDLQDSKVQNSEIKCPKCLWQCGPIYVNSDYLQNRVVSED